MTLEELQSRASRGVEKLGAPPDTARAQAHWRERRERAALELAAAADWDAVSLSQAMLLCGDSDDPVRQLLLDARDYCPRRNR